jgi:hypothetical protein
MTNCFDLRCPKCGSTDQIEVSASIWARVTNDGTDTDLSKKSRHEWGDDSPARCAACGHFGKVTGFRQDEYMAYFRTTAGPADDIFEADTPEQALELARTAFTDDPGKFGFSPADCGYLELQEIRIVDDDAEEVLCWMSDEYRLQLYAPKLLQALETQLEITRAIIDAWNNTDHLYSAVEDLISELDSKSQWAQEVLRASERCDLTAPIEDLEKSLDTNLAVIAQAKGGAE